MNRPNDPEDPNEDVLLTVSELCARMCISVSYLYRLLASGLFPPLVRVGRRSCRLPEHVLDSWLWQCIEMRSTMHTLRDPVVLPEWPPLVVVPSMVRAIRMVRFPAVLRRVGLKRSPLYRQIAERRFPAPVPLGPRVRRWAVHELDHWMRGRVGMLSQLRQQDRDWYLRRPEDEDDDDRPGAP